MSETYHVLIDGVTIPKDSFAERDARLRRAAPQLAEALRLMVLLCSDYIDFRNGNTADNGADEGDIRSRELIDAARAALTAAGVQS